SSRRRNTRVSRDWSSDVCSSDLAWYVDASDWSLARGSDGSEGVPSELRDAVLAAMYDARVRLWREYGEERADADAGAWRGSTYGSAGRRGGEEERAGRGGDVGEE